jgi:hypothetical protein
MRGIWSRSPAVDGRAPDVPVIRSLRELRELL